MTQPFVISAKLTGDSASMVGATREARQEVQRLTQAVTQSNQAGAAGIDAMLGIGGSGRSAEQAAADIAAYGTELDNLRARFNPLFAVIRQYKSAVAEIREANAVGAISEDEMTAAIERNRKATLAQITAIKSGGAVATGGGPRGYAAFQTANIAAQFQDIAVSAAMGFNPLQIGLQQGTQLSAALGNEGLKGTLGSLRGAITALINPTSLVTIGLIAAGAAGVEAFGALVPKSETAAEALKRQHDELVAITQGYSGAKQAVDDFQTAASALPRGAVLSNLDKEFKDIVSEGQAFRDKVSDFLFKSSPGVGGVYGQVRDLLGEFKQNKISASDLVTELTKISNTELGPLDIGMKSLVGDMLDGARKAAQFQTALVNLEHIAAGVGHNGGVQIALDSMLEGKRSAQGQQIELDALNAKSPAQKADIARRREALQLADAQISDSLRQQKIDQAGALAYAQAMHGITEADRNRLMALTSTIAAQKVNLQVVGMSIADTQRLQFVQQNLAAAEQEAVQNGTTVTKAYRDQVEAIGTAFGKLQQQTALKSLSSDLQFARDQLGRSSIDQTVASTLRPIFGDDYAKQMDGATAAQIRYNEALKQTYDVGLDLTSSVLSTMKSDLLNGASAWTILGDAGETALDKIASKALDMAAEGIWDTIFNAGKSSGNGIFGSILSWLGGGSGASVGHNASGADYWRGGLTAVNENGGEIIDLPNGTRIIPHDVATNSSGGNVVQFSPSTTINFAGASNVSAAQLQEALEQRDAQWREQLPGIIAKANAAPWRR